MMRTYAGLLLAIVVCISCGGGAPSDDGDINKPVVTATPTPSPTPTPDLPETVAHYKIGGIVAGLSGSVKIMNNKSETLVLSTAGTFQFSSIYAVGESFLVSLVYEPTTQHCTLMNQTGVVAAADITNIQISCVNKQWQHPTNIQDYFTPGSAAVLSYDVDSNHQGDTVVAWTKSVSIERVYLGYRIQGVWTMPINENIPLSVDSQVSAATAPKVAIAKQGSDFVVAWLQKVNGKNQVFLADYHDGVLSKPQNLNEQISPPLNADASKLDIAMDAVGNARLLWQQKQGDYTRIYMSVRSVDSDGAVVWKHPTNSEFISINASTHSDMPRLAMSPDGHALVAWRQVSSGVYRLFKNEYFGASAILATKGSDAFSPNNDKDVSEFEVAINDSGYALVGWRQPYSDNTSKVFLANKEGGTWYYPTIADFVSPLNTVATGLRLAVDAAGNALLGYAATIKGGDGVPHIYMNHRLAGVWLKPLGETSYFVAGQPKAALQDLHLDDNGNAIVIYSDSDAAAVAQLYKSEFRGGNWLHPSGLADNVSPDAYAVSPQGGRALMGNNGNAQIFWLQQTPGGVLQLLMSQYY